MSLSPDRLSSTSSRSASGARTRRPARITAKDLVRSGLLLLLAYAALTAVWVGIGLLITGPLGGTSLSSLDTSTTNWLVEHRTPTLDRLSEIGSLLAETMVKVVATAVIAVVMFAVWRSWREPFLVCFSLILEAAVFITVTGIVGRERPAVEQLDQVSVGTSFPSGHAAAATAYAAIAIVIFEHTRNRWIRAVTVLLAVAVPIVVGLSRMYRGVHYLTDALGGALLGIACVAAVYLIANRCVPRAAASGDDAAATGAPHRAR
jgi:undecaprenyl-diphosphatase